MSTFFRSGRKSLAILASSLVIWSCSKDEHLDPSAVNKSSFEKSPKSVTSLMNATPRVLVNGVPLSFPLGQPVNNNGVVMVPMNVIFTRLGYTVTWDQAAQKATASKPGKTIEVWIGSTQAKVNGVWTTMAAAPYISNNTTLIHSRFVAEASGCRTDWDQESQSVQIYYYDELDYGIYFYSNEPGTEGSWDQVGCQKFVLGQSNPYFDPTKPTIIYVHGNQPENVVKKVREDFHLTAGGVDVHTQNSWKNAGWNVAIFHWIQLADEGLLNSVPPASTEAKIYSTTGQSGMRWRKSDGSYETVNVPTKTVTQLFADEYQKVFGASYTGTEIRLIGNSLGGNTVMSAALELHRRGQVAARMPKRLTLMDPYWTPLSNTTVWLPNNASNTADLGGISAEMMSSTYGMAIEYFRTSLLGAMGTSYRTAQTAAFTHLVSDYLGSDHISKHTVPVRSYLWSHAGPAPIEVIMGSTSYGITGKVAASAATSNTRIREMMQWVNGQDFYWQQVEGKSTPAMSDDRYERMWGTL